MTCTFLLPHPHIFPLLLISGSEVEAPPTMSVATAEPLFVRIRFSLLVGFWKADIWRSVRPCFSRVNTLRARSLSWEESAWHRQFKDFMKQKFWSLFIFSVKLLFVRFCSDFKVDFDVSRDQGFTLLACLRQIFPLTLALQNAVII